MKQLKSAVIVACHRSAVGKSGRGSLVNTRPDEFGAQVLKQTIAKARVAPELIDDVLVGCAMPEAEQGLNIARNIALYAGLPDTVSGVTINRKRSLCSLSASWWEPLRSALPAALSR